jgi:hypothetical protein
MTPQEQEGNKAIQVRINPDGVTCKEVNPIPYPETEYDLEGHRHGALPEYFDEWLKKEDSLRTFEIEENRFMQHHHLSANHPEYWQQVETEWEFEPGEIHSAEILPNGKIKIVP